MSSVPAAAHPSPTAPAARPPRPSATLILLRDAPAGLEVLLLRRAERGDHNSGAWVFPGGILEKNDRAAHACTDGDDAAISARLGLPSGGLDYAVAVLRECFEECGLLLAHDTQGALPAPSAVAALQSWRGTLHRGERTLVEFCTEAGVRLAADRLVYFSHWLTPVGRAKRFDTRFFVAGAPAGQDVTEDGVEITAHRWLRPADALAPDAGLRLMNPTRASLTELSRYACVSDALSAVRAASEIPCIVPRIGTGSKGERPVNPDEYAWAEIGRLDPQGAGTACYELQPGVPVRLSPRMIRVTANNGSSMTGPGTNTYLIGGGAANEWAAVDPGPDDPAHVQAVLAAAPGPIRWIFVTHTHIDHSPATVALKAATGAIVHGRVAKFPDRQDASFVPDVALKGGERFELPEATLRVVHTPGHASNHLCYLLEEERLLLTGDHVMQSSTVVINPPDGDMAAYIASLRALIAEHGSALEWLAPGHGFLMQQPKRAFEKIIVHRLKREEKVVARLRAAGGGTAQELLPAVYDDVPARMHPVAMRSLLAHLFKLRDDGAARETAGRWTLVTDAP